MSTTSAPRFRGVCQISVTAHDLERATAFYRDVLGLRHLFSAGSVAFFDCGGVRLMLARPETHEFDHPGSILYFDVADIAASAGTLAEHGVRMEGAPHVVGQLGNQDVWVALFRDSEGSLMGMQSLVERPA